MSVSHKSELEEFEMALQGCYTLAKIFEEAAPSYSEYVALKLNLPGVIPSLSLRLGFYRVSYVIAKFNWILLKEALRNELAEVIRPLLRPLSSRLDKETILLYSQGKAFVEEHQFPQQKLWERLDIQLLTLTAIIFAFVIPQQELGIYFQILQNLQDRLFELLQNKGHNPALLSIFQKFFMAEAAVGLVILRFKLHIKTYAVKSFRALSRLYSRFSMPGEAFLLIESIGLKKVDTEMLNTAKTRFEKNLEFLSNSWKVKQNNLDVEIFTDFIPALISLYLTLIAALVTALLLIQFSGKVSFGIIFIFAYIAFLGWTFVGNCRQAFLAYNLRKEIALGESSTSTLETEE